LVNQREHVLETVGTNLREVMLLNGIDHRRTISNDICEVYSVLGIEAARQCLMNEIKLVLDGGGTYLNYRHLSLLCDAMCVRGYIMPMNREGIYRVDVGPLRKCSYGDPVDILLKAGAFSQSDPVTGVSENIMLGKFCRMGTGIFDLVMDPSKAKEAMFIAEQSGEEVKSERMEIVNMDYESGVNYDPVGHFQLREEEEKESQKEFEEEDEDKQDL